MVENFGFMDAFLSLKDIPDEDVASMIKPRPVTEAKKFNLNNSKDVDEAQEFLDSEEKDDNTLEVIDADPNAIERITKKDSYIGQAILTCRRCQAPLFMDMKDLIVSEDDDTCYNVDTECPNCHGVGKGFDLQGQAAKVTKEETVEIENDTKDDTAPTFDNDFEEEPAVEETEEEVEETSEDSGDSIFDFEEEEDDGLDTEETEEDEEEKLSKDGDVIDRDDVPEDDDEVKEALEEVNPYAEKAWMLNEIITALNNEEAYYCDWIYYWPDGETREECNYDFGTKEKYEELLEIFDDIYREYHEDGLYDPSEEVAKAAKEMDRRLHLAPIEILESLSEKVHEAIICNSTRDFLEAFLEPEKINRVAITEGVGRVIYDGDASEMPCELCDSEFGSFDVADGFLTCNIDSSDSKSKRKLGDILNHFNNENSNKVCIWDLNDCDEVFCGNKQDAIDQYGDCAFISFEVPAVLRIQLKCDNGNECVDCKELEPKDKLVNDIIDANGMSTYRVDRQGTNENWISESIHCGDDLDIVYDRFVRDTNNKLINEFKKVTGFRDELDEALEKYGKTLKEDDEEIPAAELDDLIEIQDEEEAPVKAEDKEIIPEDEVIELIDDETGEPIEIVDDETEDEVLEIIDDEESEEEASEEPVEECKVKSFKSRKELAEYLDECKNNNRPFIVKRSVVEGYRYDVVEDFEVVDEVPEETDSTEIVDAQMSEEEREILRRISEVSKTICTAVWDAYGIELDPKFVVSDIIQDLRLVSGAIKPEDLDDTPLNQLTKQMYSDYTAYDEFVGDILNMFGFDFDRAPESKLARAISQLKSPSFDEENIRDMINSDRFIEAARQGAIPGIREEDIRLIGEALINKSPLTVNIDLPNIGGDHNNTNVLSHVKEGTDEALINKSPVSINVNAPDLGGSHNDVNVLSTEVNKKDESIEEAVEDDEDVLNALDSFEDSIEDLSDRDDVEEGLLNPLSGLAKTVTTNVNHAANVAKNIIGEEKECNECDITEAKKDDELPPDPEAVKIEVQGEISDLTRRSIDAAEAYEAIISDIAEKPLDNKSEVIADLRELKDKELETVDELNDIASDISFEKKEEVKPIEEEPALEALAEDFDPVAAAKKVAELKDMDFVGIEKVEGDSYKVTLQDKANGEPIDSLMTKGQLEQQAKANEVINEEFEEFDTETFDADINNYFREAYNDEKMSYKSLSGSIDKSTNRIQLEGLLSGEGTEANVVFTLEPSKVISEDLSEEKVTYKVTNNLSEETFEFSF